MTMKLVGEPIEQSITEHVHIWQAHARTRTHTHTHTHTHKNASSPRTRALQTTHLADCDHEKCSQTADSRIQHYPLAAAAATARLHGCSIYAIRGERLQAPSIAFFSTSPRATRGNSTQTYGCPSAHHQ